MQKLRFQVTLHPVLVKQADILMADRGFSSLSEFLESLIRNAHDERFGVTVGALNDAATPYKTSKPTRPRK